MRRSLFLVLSFLTLLVSVVACQPKSPEEQVAALRQKYTVELNTWYAKDVAPAEPMLGEMEDGEMADGEMADAEASATDEAADEATDEAMEGDEGAAEGDDATAAMPAMPQTRDIFFDLIVLYDGREEPLPGLTLRITQADGSGGEKSSWLRYVELPGTVKGETKQVSFTESGVEFEEGDQFALTLEAYVAPEDRGEYREFASADAG